MQGGFISRPTKSIAGNKNASGSIKAPEIASYFINNTWLCFIYAKISGKNNDYKALHS